MKKIIVFILALASFAACDLTKLEPAQTEAFMKYFGADGNTTAVDLLKVSDGYLLLGNNLARNNTTYTAIIIKTDENGNRLWSSSWANVRGAALAQSSDSYFIVGDSINNTNPQNTRLSLIKTDFNGTETARAQLGETGTSYHGAAVAIMSNGEIVVSGTTNEPGTANQIILYGYDNNLTSNWTVRKFPSTADGNARYTAKTIIESDQGNIIWSELVNTSGTISMHVRGAAPDSETISESLDLFENNSLLTTPGDLNTSFNLKASAVQSINKGSRTGIGLYIYKSATDTTTVELTNASANLVAGSLSIVDRAQGDEFIVVGSSDYHPDNTARFDTDFYVAKIDYNGEISESTGFEKSFGTTGDETAVAVVPAHNNGFVILGTLKNTNEVSLMTLVKINSKGELIN